MIDPIEFSLLNISEWHIENYSVPFFRESEKTIEKKRQKREFRAGMVLFNSHTKISTSIGLNQS